MSAAVSTSKIPVAAHRRQSTSSNRTSPERPTPPRKDSSPSKIPTPSSSAPAKERPQSIDIEDEFKNTLQYARLVATLQQGQDQSSRSKAAEQVTSPSRIPVAARKLSSESLDRSSGEASPVKSRKNGLDSYIIAENNSSCSEESPVHRTKIPMLKNTPRGSSPPKQKGPVFGWSLSPERQLSPDKALSRQHSSSTSSVSSSTATSKTAKSSDSGAEHLISASGEGDNGERPTSAELKLAKKKQYEAFVMTGDRMICLAKTPANSEFIKKTVSHRQSGNLQQVPYEEQPVEDSSTSVPCSPVKPDLPVTGANVKPMVRGSTSEEQLLLPPSLELLDDAATGSVDTLLGPSSEVVKPHQRKASLKSSLESSPGSKRPAQQSPDFSTSSLISSEHYNGESLLDPDNLSPQSSSSPDTPEWSLMDSFHKQRNGGDCKPQAALESIASADEKSSDADPIIQDAAPPAALQPQAEEAIKSDGNRVIITIGTNLPNSSMGPADLPPPPMSLSDRPMSETKAMNSLNSSVDSSEESDLESLQSYHPPVRTIDVPSAERLAKRLFYLDGFKRTDVSRHLGKNNEFSQVVAEEYLRYFDFGEGISLDMALRRFLQHFCLTGETQERERVLLHFSRRYLECNPDYVHDPAKQLFRSLDAVHTLTCAIMLLNTDLHGDSVGLQRKMTCNEFIENLRELNDGHNFPRDLLRTIYYSIKETPVPWASALEEMGAAAAAAIAEEPQQTADPVKQVMATFSDANILRTEENPGMYGEERSEASNLAIGKTGGGINPFINLPDQSTAVDYKKGYVVRKCCVDPNGKKTKLGKRSWRMFFINLRDMVLYCFKDEKAVRQPGAFEDYSSAIRIHHGLAVRASDYTKKQFVFRLHTADRAEYLFRTSDEKELLTWIDAINYVVASFSAPPLPAACSSGGRFQRPLMPSSKSSLAMNEQLLSHENQLGQLRSDFEELLRSAPHKHAKSTVWQNYREKEDFLTFEIMRYETYILTLRTKNAHET